jgi:hypothetical protein
MILFPVLRLLFFIVCNAQTVKSALVDMTQNELFDYVVEQFVDSKCCDTKSRPYLKKNRKLVYYSGVVKACGSKVEGHEERLKLN